MSAPALQVQDLHYRLGTKTIVRAVSFAVERGHYLSIIGPNGAGKTTLIKCLNRILLPKQGRIDVFGKPLRAYSQRELAKVMSYVPQADGRQFPFSVYEFVMMGRYPYLSPFSSIQAEDRQKVEEILALTGIEAFAKRVIHTLSGGERQKVFVAAALAQGAEILLLDEPTTFLDYKHQVEITALLQRLNRDQGITIVSVTHDINAAVLTGHSVLALKDGAVLFHGEPGTLIEGDTLSDLYDTQFQLIANQATGIPIILPTGEEL